MHPPAKTSDQAGLDRRARFAIAACVVLPVLIGVLVTAGTFRAKPAPPPPVAGHWVYVQSLTAAVHVDGGNKKVDAQIPVGSASPDSIIVQDQHAAYVVDADKMVVFTKSGGVTGTDPAPGVAEEPVPVQAAGTTYLVYRAAGVILPLGGGQEITVDGPLGAPVMTATGELWVHRVDTGDVCVVADKALRCVTKVGRQGALTLLNGRPVFVDTTASTWQPLTSTERPTKLNVPLPANAIVGGSSVDGRIPVIDPAAKRLLLIAATGAVLPVPLGPGDYDRPYTAGGTVGVLETTTGRLTSYDAQGDKVQERALGGTVRMTQGDDGRVYADAVDGSQSVVMDEDGTLTPVRTGNVVPPTYTSPVPTTVSSLPPANVTVTTTETIPAAPDTVIIETPASTPDVGANGGTGGGTGGGAGGSSSSKPNKPTSTKPLPGAPPGSPTVDVLSATSLGGGRARVHISVHGEGPVFCHVFFNSVERAAAQCSGVMDVTATGIPPHQLYDVYVLGVNAKGMGNPGRRAELAL